MLAAESLAGRLLRHRARLLHVVPAGASAGTNTNENAVVQLLPCRRSKHGRSGPHIGAAAGAGALAPVASHHSSSMAVGTSVYRSWGTFDAGGIGFLACNGSVRMFSSSTTHASLLGDDGFNPFTTHHNVKDAERADRMVRDYVTKRLNGGAAIEVRQDFLGGVLNSYRVLSEKAAEQARLGRRTPDASFARKADDLLAFAEQAYEQDPALFPGKKSYSMVVDVYAKIGDPEGAEAVLWRLEKIWKAGNAKVKPDTILYNVVIDSWAKSGKREAHKRAETILEHMEQLNQQDHEVVCPNAITYNAVINAWARSREKGAAQRAEAILNHMMKLHESGREDCSPNAKCFTSVIDAWAKSREIGAAQRAEAILEHMEQLHQQGLEDVRPNTIIYNAVINAWAKSREKGAAKRAEAILNHTMKLHEGGREDCCPNAQSFTTVIDAWARSRDKDAPKRAEALLAKIDELHRRGYRDMLPNVVSYNAVINTWAKSREHGAAQRAEAILNHMLKLHESGREECHPTVTSFNTVVDAWAKSRDKNAYDHASRVFRQMMNMENQGYTEVQPNVITYNAQINALAVSNIPDKAPRAYKMLLELENKANHDKTELAPNTQSYGVVLKACSRSSLSGTRKEKEEALRIALMTFEKLRKAPNVPIDAHKYAPLFTVISSTTNGDTMAKLMSEVFRLCCEDGVLHDNHLKDLRRYTPKNVFIKLVGTNASDVTVRDLPPEWSRNNSW